ncbi:MAG: pyridoxamine 5'-phosphate oxidase family protein [Firmicutes bacterium]|nr:pyridoxamine 5'-phosphate oxidase family protein [Bacillota bacterium]
MRRKDREVTDIAEIRRILDKADILHMGLFDGDYPYVVPVHYGYEFREDTLVFYTHGAKEGHKLDLIRKDPHICVQVDCDVETLPAKAACGYGSTFASVIAKGKAEILEDPAEKAEALKILMKCQTGMDFPINGAMASAVAVLKITASEFTAKRNPGPQKKEE